MPRFKVELGLTNPYIFLTKLRTLHGRCQNFTPFYKLISTFHLMISFQYNFQHGQVNSLKRMQVFVLSLIATPLVSATYWINNSPIFLFITKQMLPRTFHLLFLLFPICMGYYLTPAAPPTGFVNSYYEARFRVRSLDDPVFTFYHLPEGLQATKQGVISGVPRKTGSFLICVKFCKGKIHLQKQMLLIIQEDPENAKLSNIRMVPRTKIEIMAPKNLVFTVGEQIDLRFYTNFGIKPEVWSFGGVPPGLTLMKPSSLSGVCNKKGTYTISILVADCFGRVGQTFVMVNIQPKILPKKSSIVVVPHQPQTTYLDIDLEETRKQQIEADKEVIAALRTVELQKTDVKKDTALVNQLEEKVKTVKLIYSNIVRKKYQFQKELRKADQEQQNASRSLLSAQESLNLTILNARLASAANNRTIDQVTKAEIRYQTSTFNYKEAAQNLKVATKAKIDCDLSIDLLKKAAKLALYQQQQAFNHLKSLKNDLSEAKNRRMTADHRVAQNYDALALVEHQRDNYQSNLNIITKQLKVLQKKLADKENQLRKITLSAQYAQKEAGTASFELEQAISRLYVAQAAKEAADRLSAIALATLSTNDHFQQPQISKQALNFSCKHNSYPSMVGISPIKQVFEGGYTLQSGKTIVYSSCSERPTCQVGDIVRYQGYIEGSLIKTRVIKKM